MRAQCSCRVLTAARACSQLLEHADSCLCPQFSTTVSPAAGGYSTTVSPAAGGNARSVLLQSTDSCVPARSSWSMLTAACAHSMQQRSPQPQVAIQQRSPQPQVAMRAQCSCRVLTAARACSQLLEHADSCLCPQYATTVSPAAGGYATTVSPAAGGNARSVLLQSTDSCSCLLAALGACRQLPVPSVFNNGLPSRSVYSTTVSPAAGGNARLQLWQDTDSCACLLAALGAC